MDAATQAALAALSASHPTHAAALIAAATKPGATAQALTDLVKDAEAKATADKLAALDAENGKLKADLAAAQKKSADDAAEIAKLKAASGTVAAFASNIPKDPGADDLAANATTASEAQFLAMSAFERAAFRQRGGKISNSTPGARAI